MEKRVLKFHTGRGGRFNNSGYVKFVGIERIDEGKAYKECWLDEEGYLMDCSPNALEAVINEDGTGYINHDNDYDTTTCVLENDLTEKQIHALIRDADSSFDSHIVRGIITDYYPDYEDLIN